MASLPALAWVQRARLAVLAYAWMLVALPVDALAPSMALPMLQLKHVSINATSDTSTALPAGIAFVHTGHLYDIQILCALQAQLSHPNTSIIIILDKNSSFDRWQAVAEGTKLHLHRPQNWDAVDKFMSIYRHASTNQPGKEAFSIYQYLLVLDYMISHNTSSLLHLDLGSGLFDDLAKTIPPDAVIAGVEAVAVHWTKTSLTKYTNFIWRFYGQDDIDLARSIVRWGDVDLDGALAGSPSVTSWWPEGTPMCQMSAIRMFHTFQQTSGVLSTLCMGMEELCCPDGLQLLKELNKLQSISTEHITASSIQQLHQMLFWRQDPAAGWQPWTRPQHRNSLAIAPFVPGLHLQFPAKPMVQHMLCDNILRHSDTSAAEDVCFPRVAYDKAVLDHLWIESMMGV